LKKSKFLYTYRRFNPEDEIFDVKPKKNFGSSYRCGRYKFIFRTAQRRFFFCVFNVFIAEQRVANHRSSDITTFLSSGWWHDSNRFAKNLCSNIEEEEQMQLAGFFKNLTLPEWKRTMEWGKEKRLKCMTFNQILC
jgi:hypothetical protein